MNKPGIYQIRNLTNGRLYIGSAINLRIRKNLHWSQLRKGTHHTSPLQNAWNKYGEASFVFEVLLIVPAQNLIEYEQFCIDFFRAIKIRLYNVKRLAHSSLGRKASPETLEKLRIASTGRPKSAETRAKLSASLKGLAKSPEHIAKVAAKKRGSKWTEEAKRRCSEGRKGRLFLTPEAILARSKPYPALIAPDGTRHPAGFQRAEFCRQHGLLESGFNKLCRGHAKVCRGWRLAPE